MPRYARAVIPGRSTDPRDLDRMVFGGRAEEADENDYEEDEDEEEGDDGFVHRAPRDRRRGGRRREDFAPLPDDRDGSYAEGGSSFRGAVLALGALVVVGVFGAVVWNAYKGGVRVDDGEAAPLLAASGPIKTRPPAGAKPSPSALTAGVFDRMEGRDPDAPKVVIEAPVRSEAATPEAVKAETAAPVEARPAPVAPKPEPVAQAEAKPLAPAVEVTPAPVANAPKPLVATAPEPKPEAVEPAALAGAFAPKFLPGAAYLVQIGAADSVAGADEEYARRARAAPDLFAGAERVVVPAMVNGNQVYRVRVGSFASAEDANAFCSAYKSRIGDCFRATR